MTTISNSANDKISARSNANPATTPLFKQDRSNIRLPPQLNRKAYHGVAGRIVDKVTEHTEADGPATLVQFLVAVGNMIGRKACMRVSSDSHRCNLYTVIVGPTAKGRKGLALSTALWFLSCLNENYIRDNVREGLASGEGLIAHVRDPVKKYRRPNAAERKRGIKGPVEYTDDPGVSDKRLLVTEEEFGGTLVVMGREGNTLSPVIRQFWQGKDKVGTLRRNAPDTATGAHISIIGHITEFELRVRLPECELFNGFANRFLWVHAKRERYFPNPKDLSPTMFKEELDYFLKPDAEGKTWSQRLDSISQMKRDTEAAQYWEELYDKIEKLEEENPQVAAITERGSPLTLRLAMIYAVLDGRSEISKAHLEAAYAVWIYCRNTARYLFGEKLSSSRAEKICAALRSSYPKWMSRTDIRDLFGRNIDVTLIDAALSEVESFDLLEASKEEGRGRPVTKYRWKKRSTFSRV
jgi:hypothetical protein